MAQINTQQRSRIVDMIGQGLNLAEIARELKISRERVRQLKEEMSLQENELGDTLRYRLENRKAARQTLMISRFHNDMRSGMSREFLHKKYHHFSNCKKLLHKYFPEHYPQQLEELRSFTGLEGQIKGCVKVLEFIGEKLPDGTFTKNKELLKQHRITKIRGRHYLVECQHCGAVYPMQKAVINRIPKKHQRCRKTRLVSVIDCGDNF